MTNSYEAFAITSVPSSSVLQRSYRTNAIRCYLRVLPPIKPKKPRFQDLTNQSAFLFLSSAPVHTVIPRDGSKLLAGSETVHVCGTAADTGRPLSAAGSTAAGAATPGSGTNACAHKTRRFSAPPGLPSGVVPAGRLSGDSPAYSPARRVGCWALPFRGGGMFARPRWGSARRAKPRAEKRWRSPERPRSVLINGPFLGSSRS